MSRLPILILILLAIGILLRVDFVFYLAYLCIGIYGFSRWYVPRTLRHLETKRTFAPNAFLGERIPISIDLYNRSRIPIVWVHVQDSVPLQIRAGTRFNHALAVGGRERVALEYAVKALRRGYYRIGSMRLKTGDFFGISEFEATVPAEFLTIYPQIHPIERLSLSSRLPFGTLASQQRLYADPVRPIGVRTYQGGDPLHQINWKVSARQNHLMVKQLEPAISLETLIVLNLNQSAYSRHQRTGVSEWAVEVAASLAAHLTTQRQAVGLATNGRDPLAAADLAFDEATGRLLTKTRLYDPDFVAPRPDHPATIPPRTGRPHLMKVLEVLARIELDATQSLASWLPVATLRLNWGTTILLITPRADPEVMQALHRLVRSGYNPTLLLVEGSLDFGRAGGSFATIAEHARQLGFRAFTVTNQQELTTVG